VKTLTGSSDNRIYVALVHYPVTDKNGETIASAVTNLDVHDIARACRTYGVKRYYIITPLEDQRVLTNRIVAHWTHGAGGVYNPKRKQALECLRIRTEFKNAVNEIAKKETRKPITVVTSARKSEGSLSYRRLREMLDGGKPILLAFGTAWGFTETFMTKADYRLAPLEGAGPYNHLSVRSAVAITLDRLVGQ
jgi:hypothetical protein